jgi:DNA-binding NarL/FixJ family response regulator
MWRVSLLLTGLLCAACGGVSSHEDAMGQQIDIMDDMLDLLEGVNDKDSAEAAVPELKAIAERARKVAEQMKELPQPSAEEMKRLQEKHQKKLSERQGEIMKQLGKLMQYPELAKAWQDAMSSLR